MSEQFGVWNFDGKPLDAAHLETFHSALAKYAPDGGTSYFRHHMSIHYRAFHTTKESRHEKQPHILPSGGVITSSGRLDNRSELIGELSHVLTGSSTDVEIVAAAFERWGTNCLGKLLGDWALSIWNPSEQSLLLAKDPVGVRHLYYFCDNNQLIWSTILEPLVRLHGKPFALNQEYVAGWLSFFPAPHVTPYVGIHSVPASSYVLFGPRKCRVIKYWDFDPTKKIRYRTDADYEEHFRAAFAKAVLRCLRSDGPVLAELSGGMDSSSIVCMADLLIAQSAAATTRLDTISWYKRSATVQDDYPYFSKVEEKRGRTGFHIDFACLDPAARQSPLTSEFDNEQFAATLSSSVRLNELFKRYAAHMRKEGYRVVLSGQAGEQATGGGLLTPNAELQELLRTLHIPTLVRQLVAWGTALRQSKRCMLWDATQQFFRPFSARDGSGPIRPAPWLTAQFVERNFAALSGYPTTIGLFGPSPIFQEHMNNLNGIVRRELSFSAPRSEPLRDLRYPYVDRDFLEFMYALPRTQLVRVSQRRSLMKRALAGIVPNEILNRVKRPFVPARSAKDSSALNVASL